MIEVKICGVTRAEDALLAAELGAELIGFNFWPGSKRYCPPDVAQRIIERLPPRVKVVGVFVNPQRAQASEVAKRVGLHLVQLHGDERPEACTGYAVPVVKAVQVRETPTLQSLRSWPVQALLLDAPSEGFGGSGRTFAWQLAAGVSRELPVWLAGGLTPENVGDAIRAVRPRVVDVASGVEVAPGIKDPDKLARFIAAAREAVR